MTIGLLVNKDKMTYYNKEKVSIPALETSAYTEKIKTVKVKVKIGNAFTFNEAERDPISLMRR